MFIIQMISYGIICINLRAVADANYLLSAFTDMVFSTLNFFIIKKVAESGNLIHKWAGYTLGSVAGTFLGIFLSKFIMGH